MSSERRSGVCYRDFTEEVESNLGLKKGQLWIAKGFGGKSEGFPDRGKTWISS